MLSVSQHFDENTNWQKLKCGDLLALGFFYEKYADLLLNYGLTVTNNRDLVQDAVQELFINIWNRRHHLSVPDSAKYYLMASLRRIIIKDIRQARQLTDNFSVDSFQFSMHESLFTEDHQEDLHFKLQQAIGSLPARQKEIIFLRFFQKLSYEDISAMTGLEYQVLRNTIYRAIKTLRISLLKSTPIISLLTVLLSFN